MKKVLDLPLKAKWYEMIECGEKLEEYREIKPYWCNRLLGASRTIGRQYTHVRFRYGYTRKTMTFEIKDIVIGEGKPEWGAERGKKYFVIKLGRIEK